MLSENPRISAVLDQLLAMNGQELLVMNVASVIPHSELETQKMNFWDVARHAQKMKLLLIGWRRGMNGGKSLMNSIEINPADKTQKVQWNSNDQLLIIGKFGHSQAVVFEV